MKKTIITLIAAGVVVGGGFLYKASRDAKNNPIITIQGVDAQGVNQKVVFTNEGCSITGGQGRTVQGTANSQDLQNTCQPGQGSNLTQSQFDCAVNLCKGPAATSGQNQTRTSSGCSNPTVTYGTTSSGGSTCTVKNCTLGNGQSIDGVYTTTQSDYVSQLNQWGMDSKGLAMSCAGIEITNTPDQSESALGTIDGRGPENGGIITDTNTATAPKENTSTR